MRRAVHALAASLVLITVIASCGCSKGDDKKMTEGKSSWGAESPDKTKAPEKATGKAPPSETGRDVGKNPEDRPDSKEPKTEDAHVGGVKRDPGKVKGPPAGMLTAGSFDDNRDPQPYRSFFRQIGQDSVLGDLPSRFLGHRLILTVKDGGGQPV